jgi:hypothetical protein
MHLPSIPGGFFVGYVKEQLTGRDCTTREEPQNAAIAIVSEMGRNVLMAMFVSWQKRVNWVIEHQTESSQRGTIREKHFYAFGREMGSSYTS